MKAKFILILFILTVGLLVSGCGEKDEMTIDYEDEDMKIESNIPEGAEDQWCPAGSSWTETDSNTGEVYSMEVVGTEVINGMNMCHAIYESDEPENGVSKVEYFWSENEENFIMTFYDESGDVVSEMKILDGTTTITAEDGSVTVIDEDGKMTITDPEGNVQNLDFGASPES